MTHHHWLPPFRATFILSCLFVSAVAIGSDVRVAAQAPGGTTSNDHRGVHLTVFRSPATGLEYRFRRLGVFGGFYPTILKADDATDGKNTNFIRAGLAWYSRDSGVTPFVAPSLMVSLDEGWDHGVLTEAGVRIPLGRRVALRGGVGVLTTFDGETRINPTIGVDVRIGSR